MYRKIFLSFLAFIFLLPVQVEAATYNYSINETRFPDATFRNFVKQNYDTNNNNQLDIAEYENIEMINVSGKGISDLTGIECFESLTELYCQNNNLSKLDISKNTELEILFCFNNRNLSELDLTKNTSLTRVSCYGCNIAELDITKNTALTWLKCSSNGMTDLDLSYNKSITWLDCSDNNLTDLDLSNNTALTELYCSYNDLDALDLGNNDALEILECTNNNLNGLDLRSNSNLESVSVGAQNIAGLVVEESGGKYTADLSNFFTGISKAYVITSSVLGYDSADQKVSTTYNASKALATFKEKPAYMKYNYSTGYNSEYMDVTLTYRSDLMINATNFPDENFREYVSENFDSDSDGYLDDEEIADITEIDVSSKGLTDLSGVENFTNLTTLKVHNNNLTEIDVRKLTKLQIFMCHSNQISELDISNNTALTQLRCQSNKLSELDVTNNTALTALYCTNNNLAELDLSAQTALSTRNISGQNIDNLIIIKSSDQSTYYVDLNNYVDDVSKINSVTAKDSSNNSITVTYSDGVATFDELPESVTYNYDTGYKTSTLMGVTLTASNSPVILTSELENITVDDINANDSYSFTLEATGAASIVWTVSGDDSLPDGLELDEDTGEISGTPTSYGNFKFGIVATNSYGSDAKEFNLKIPAVAPVLTLGALSLDAAAFGEAYSVTITATGTQPINLSLSSGTLPDGLTFNASTGEISGTPTKGGTFEFTIEASNRVDSDKVTYTIEVTVEENKKPSITTSSLSSGILKNSYSETVTADGEDTITFKISSGSLPTGLKIDSDTGEISGTPTKKGTYTFTVKAENDYGSDTAEFSITITEVPVISTKSLLNGTINKKYSSKLAVSAGSPVTWALTNGTLPAGLEFNGETGQVSGTPTETCSGLELTFIASNDVGSAEKTVTLTIKGVKPKIASVAKDFSAGVVGESYSGTLEYTGTETVTITAEKLPDGLSVSSTGEISGTPTKSGNYSVKFKATNDTGYVTKSIKIVIYDKPVISTAKIKEGTTGKSYSAKLTLSAGPKSVTWSLSDGATLPDGLTFVEKTATIKGKPTGFGTYTFNVKASTVAGDATADVTIKINAVPPKISTSSLKKGTMNANYSAKLKASKGTAPITWSTSSTLPAGLTLDASEGTLSGTPTEAGEFSLTIVATNAAGETAEKTYKLVIKPEKPVIDTASLPDGTVGSSYSAQMQVSQGVNITWSWSGTKPAGLTISESGLISGTPTKAKNYKVKIKAKNSAGSASKSFTLIIAGSASDTSAPYEFSTATATTTASTGFSGELIENTREGLTPEMVNLAQSDEYLIAAVLPEISVTESGFYEIPVELDEEIPEGLELVWKSFPVYDDDEAEAEADDENESDIAEFYDESGEEVTEVPESHFITVSVYLEAGTIYEPIIAVKVEK